jgi:CubicO group peptidase (beta-lactamase class C family)
MSSTQDHVNSSKRCNNLIHDRVSSMRTRHSVVKYLAILLLACAACASVRPPSQDIDAIVSRYHSAGKFSGAVLVGRGETIVYQRAIGVADEAWNVPATLETRFQIGSLTKQFTSALIYELAEQHRIDLDQPLSAYLPEYRADVGQAITIRQLLGHSAGVPDFVRRPDIMELLKHPATPAEVVRDDCSGVLEFTPGTRFKYSNCGYLILGAVYERLSGETYAEGLRRLTSRAGLVDTGVNGPRAVVPRLATAYVVEGKERMKAPYIEWSVAFSSGAVYSTVLDLWRWRNALLSGRALGARAPGALFALRPYGYSYGWHVGATDEAHLRKFLASDYDVEPVPPSASMRLASHSGDLPGFHSSMTILLDGSWTVVLLDNHDSKWLPDLAAEIILAERRPAR